MKRLFLMPLLLMVITFAMGAENITITGDNIPESGKTSAYISHTFRINSLEGDYTDPKWILSLPLADGDYECLTLQDNDFSCEVPEIVDYSMYDINSNGEIEGSLLFSCIHEGKETVSEPFSIRFELRPLIESAVIDGIEDNYPFDSYNANYTVKYHGAEQIKVTVEEEYSSKIHTTYLTEPLIAHGCASYIMNKFNAWIDFYAENQFGNAKYTIELGPYGEVLGSYSGDKPEDSGTDQILDSASDPLLSCDRNTVRFNKTVDRLNVYDVAGNLLCSVENIDIFHFGNLNHGIYIIVYQSGTHTFNRKISLF